MENSHPAIQSLESLQTRAMEEFSKVASYFGEDGKSTKTEAFFGIFSDFISKFEVSCAEFDSSSFDLCNRCLTDPGSPTTPEKTIRIQRVLSQSVSRLQL